MKPAASIPQPRRRTVLVLATLVVCSLLVSALLSPANRARAGTVTTAQRPLLFRFDGSGTTAGVFGEASLSTVAVDEASGSVYVADNGHKAVDRLDGEGRAVNFPAGPAAGHSSLYGTGSETFTEQGQYFFELFTDLAVDNSGGHGGAGEGEQGRLYVSGSGGPIDAFKPNGEFLWTLPRSAVEGDDGVAVDHEGHLWVGTGYNHKVLELDTTGSGPPSTTPIKEFTITSGNETAGRLAVDRGGADVYVAGYWPQGGATLDKYVSGAFDSTVSSEPTRAVAVDQSLAAGHVFALHQRGFDEFEPCAVLHCALPLLGSFGGDLLGPSGPTESRGGIGIAYYPTRDWVYVAENASSTVKVFGPRATGTVPDVKIEPTGAIEETAATAHGRINPQGVPNSYHFEWVKAEAQHIAVEASGGKFAITFAPKGEDPQPGGQNNTGATGSGTLQAGSVEVKSLQVTSGAYKVGDEIAGKGVPAETTITAVNEAEGKLTLSSPATVNGYSELGAYDLPFDASPGEVRAALESLSAIGAGNVAVTGAPGSYNVLFKGAFVGRDLPQLTCAPSTSVSFHWNQPCTAGLSGSSPTVSIATLSDGQPWVFASNEKSSHSEAEWPESYRSISPPDSTEHAVSYSLTGLQRNSGYAIRLVGTDTEAEGSAAKRLDAYSQPDVFLTPKAQSPTVSNLAVSGITTSSAHLTATVDPHKDATSWKALLAPKAGASQAECEALKESAFSLEAAKGAIPAEEPGTVAIAADLSGLLPAQTYCLRLVARNSNLLPGVADTHFQTLAVAPTEAETAFAAPRTDTTARLNARVNPQGEAPLTYRFEVSEDGGATWTALPDVKATLATHERVLVSEQIERLRPATEYSYRFSAENPADAGSPLQGAAKSFTTRTTAEARGPASCPENEVVRMAQRSNGYLPDCRAIEMVNSPEKGEQEVIMSDPAMMSTDGEKIVWEVVGGAPRGHNSGNSFLARRTGSTPNGWSSQDIVPPVPQQPAGGSGGYAFVAATPDLSRFLGVETVGTQNASFTGTRVIAADDRQRLQVLASYPNIEYHGLILALTSNGAHVVLVKLTAPHQVEDVGGSTPEVLSIMPEGSQAACEPVFGWVSGSERWIATADASRVYFEAKPNKAGEPEKCEAGAPAGLYVRNREAQSTTLIDPDVAEKPPAVIAATGDGRAVYFVTYSKLDPSDTNSALDLYRWDEQTGKSACLTCGLENEAGETIADANAIPNSVLVSEDLSHVYFASTSKLAPGASAGHENLYVLHDRHVGFAADVTRRQPGSEQAAWVRAELSTNGGVLVFETAANPNLTADAVASGCSISGVAHLEPCKEVYRYEDANGSVECLSCAREGATSRDATGFELSGDGSTVAFTTAQPLLHSDVNGGTDIYESREGRIGLITDGVTAFPTAAFAQPTVRAVDRDGRSIFFTVDEPGLTGFEADGMSNLYDARVGGGFQPPVPPEVCVEDSCQGPLQALPFATPPDSAFPIANGNMAALTPKAHAKSEPKPKRCGKGRMRKRVRGKARCVKRKPMSRRRARRHK